MSPIIEKLKSLFGRKAEDGAADVEALRTAFRARYHCFKLLLTANTRALDIMAEMAEAARGSRPFGMAFVESRCIGVSTSVWQIIRSLTELAPGKYESLFERFKEIEDGISPFLARERALADGPLAISLDAPGDYPADLVGGKVANLRELGVGLGLNIPDGFAVTAAACRRFLAENDLQEEIARRMRATDVESQAELARLSADLQGLIVESPLPGELETVIDEHHGLLKEKCGDGMRLAVRSSAIGEDSAGLSFAGRYRTLLNVSDEHVTRAYREVVASLYSPQAMSYRLTRGIRDDEVSMCVGCMPVVESVAGGVVHSRSPTGTGEDVVAIYSAWGLPKSVVDGTVLPDVFAVSRAEPMTMVEKQHSTDVRKTVCRSEEGVSLEELTSEERQRPSLSDEQALELARIALRIEKHFGVPQDIEWALDAKGVLQLLQSRPLQLVEHAATEGGAAPDVAASRQLIDGGISVNPGVASGPVFIVESDADAVQFPEGAVLVVAQPLPRWASTLGRAAAVVTGQGSVAGHLASVAREYGTPALFGVKNAIARLAAGQQVTVDARRCCVYEGRVESLLATQEKPRNLMEGSPVYEALENTSRHIVPLSLLDPDAPTFKPRNCRTLHDITRLCHEFAVREMFLFGKENAFPERSSKQLICDVPMQWWILNLDDGLKEEVTGRQVPLDTIASIPMLALWEGITAYAWEGPPPVDGKGLLSVMFEATRNTALVPGMRSSYTDRNYFMISRNYCSLSSRLGFHYSTVESLVSKRSGENYISFRFKGGAADSQRRCKRTLFIAELLESNGFVVDVKEDHLSARSEDHDLRSVTTRLKVLGYLIIHTRQLDMIMSNGVLVDHYRTRMQREIAEMPPPLVAV